MLTLLFALAGIGILVLAIVVEEDRFGLLMFGLGILGFIFYSNYFSILLPSPNLNPYFSSDSLVGEWADGGSTISLNRDGTASFQLSASHVNRLGFADTLGQWYQESYFNIRFAPTSGSEESLTVRREGEQIRVTKSDKPLYRSKRLRVIKYGNEFRIIIVDFPDLDYWDGHPGFGRVK